MNYRIFTIRWLAAILGLLDHAFAVASAGVVWPQTSACLLAWWARGQLKKETRIPWVGESLRDRITGQYEHRN